MNLISHSHAYSLYPKATFEDRVSICMSAPTSISHTELDKRKAARDKYVHRGWLIVPAPTAAAYLCPNSEFRNGLRYVGDPQCWIVPLEPLPETKDLNRFVPVCLRDDAVRSNVWKNNSILLDKFGVNFQVFKTWQLRDTYCTSHAIHAQIKQFFSDRGRGLVRDLDSGYTTVVHESCRAYNKNVAINGQGITSVRSIENEIRDCLQKVVLIYFTAAEHPEGVTYDLHPRAATAVWLMNFLTDIVLSFRKVPQVRLLSRHAIYWIRLIQALVQDFLHCR